MHDTSQMTNSATDIKIFIEFNKSTNPIVNKEEFQDFQSSEADVVPLAREVSQGFDHGAATTFTINDNYMRRGGGEESKKGSAPVQDRSNQFSALAAFTQKKQFNDFEIIDDAGSRVKDQALLQRQLRGLLNSQPIKIEEKGYLLQLMH